MDDQAQPENYQYKRTQIQSNQMENSRAQTSRSSPPMRLAFKPISTNINYPSNSTQDKLESKSSLKYKEEEKKVIPKPLRPQIILDLNFLSELSIQSIFMHLEECFELDEIYTRLGGILIAVNPFQCVPHLYSDVKKMQYSKAKLLLKQDPHPYAVAEKALRSMKRGGMNGNQSIIVSGTSGSGKTETTKILISYLVYRSSSDQTFLEKLLLANPALEAFGNAQTCNNLNSSRFGKIIKLLYTSEKGGNVKLVGSEIATSLLEVFRVTSLNGPRERNFHIFYMLSSARPRMLDLQILGTTPNSSQLEVYSRQFQVFQDSMQSLGYSQSNLEQLFDIIEGISWLGQIKFYDPIQEKGGVAQVPMEISDLEPLQRAASLLQLDSSELQKFLTTSKREIKCGSKTEIILKYRHLESAKNTRDTLAKILYLCIFESVVAFINEALKAHTRNQNHLSIQILDIYGFESVETNSLEQLCINYTNEKLHHFTATQLVTSLLEKFKSEGVCGNAGDGLQGIEKACMKTIQDLEQLMQRLDDQNKLNKIESTVSDLSVLLTEKLASSTVKKETFKSPHSLMISHYTGITKYSTENWLAKNHFADQSQEILQLFQRSESSALKLCCNQSQTLTAPKSTLTKEFRRQFSKLMNQLQNSSFHFILCFRPNSGGKPCIFEKDEMLPQLEGAGVQHLAKLNTGTSFPVHTDFDSLSSTFRDDFPKKFVDSKSNREVANLILSIFNLKEGQDYTVGVTEIFLTQKQSALIEVAREDREMFSNLLKEGLQKKFKLLAWRKALTITKVCGVLFIGIRKHRALKRFKQLAYDLRKRVILNCLKKVVQMNDRIQSFCVCAVVLLMRKAFKRIQRKCNIIKKQKQFLLKLMQKKEQRSISMGLRGFEDNAERCIKMAKTIFGPFFCSTYFSKLVQKKMMDLGLQSYKFFVVGQHEYEWKRSTGKLYRDDKMILEGITCVAIHPDYPQLVAIGFINHFQVLNFRAFKAVTLQGQKQDDLSLQGFIYAMKFKGDKLFIQVLPPSKIAPQSELFAIYNWLDMKYEKPEI